MSSIVVTGNTLTITFKFDKGITTRYIQGTTGLTDAMGARVAPSSTTGFAWVIRDSSGTRRSQAGDNPGLLFEVLFSPPTLRIDLGREVTITAGGTLTLTYTGDSGTNFAPLISAPFSLNDLSFNATDAGFTVNNILGGSVLVNEISVCLGIPVITDNYLDSVTFFTSDPNNPAFDSKYDNTPVANLTNATTSSGAMLSVKFNPVGVADMRMYSLNNGNTTTSDPYYARVSSFRWLIGGQKAATGITDALFTGTVGYLSTDAPGYFYRVPWGNGVTLIVLGRDHSFGQAVLNKLSCL